MNEYHIDQYDVQVKHLKNLNKSLSLKLKNHNKNALAPK